VTSLRPGALSVFGRDNSTETPNERKDDVKKKNALRRYTPAHVRRQRYFEDLFAAASKHQPPKRRKKK
jgi:hypothetical protein